MKTFSKFRKSIVEDISFMDTTPVQGSMDANGRPCVYMEHGSCVTPVSEDFSVFPDISNFAAMPDIKPKNELGDWHKDSVNTTELGARLHQSQNTGTYDDNNPDHNAIASYTDDSQPLNTKLFRSHLTGKPITKKLKLDTALEKHALPEDIHAYSGTSFDPGAIAAKHSEGHVHLPAFTSTSIKKNIATNFAQSVGEVGGVSHHHIIDFNLKKGDQRGIYVGRDHTHEDHEQISQTPHEHEYIMKRNTTVKIHPVPKIIHDHENNRRYSIWSAHIVDNND